MFCRPALPPVRSPRQDLVCRHGSGDEIALRQVALRLLQKGPVGGVFHTFGHYLHPQFLGQVQAGKEDGTQGFVVVGAVTETPVDRERVERHISQLRQR